MASGGSPRMVHESSTPSTTLRSQDSRVQLSAGDTSIFQPFHRAATTDRGLAVEYFSRKSNGGQCAYRTKFA